MNEEKRVVPNANLAGQEGISAQSVPVDPESLAQHYERDDVAVRGIVRFGVAIALAIVVACAVLYFVMCAWTAQPLTTRMQFEPALVTPAVVPGPGLDAAPETSLELMVQRERTRLHDYGWVDRDAGLVRIPIDAAMQVLVAQGVDAREGDGPDFGIDPAFQLDSSGGLFPGEWMTTGGAPRAEDETRDE